jgi:hypothetical protein
LKLLLLKLKFLVGDNKLSPLFKGEGGPEPSPITWLFDKDKDN